MIKNKSCKGQGKAISVKGCGKIINVNFRKYGLCQSCYASFILETDYGRLLLEKATLKATKSRKEFNEAEQEHKENKSLGWLLTNTKNVFHEYVRLRDKGKDCVSCGQAWSNEHQAGHFKKAELFSILRFNENNVHNQCKGCNLFNDGNEQEYALRIHLRIGKEGLKEIVRLSELDHKLNHKWNREDLKEIREKYKLKLKQLKK